jgi:hypothetical protein
MRPSTVNSNSIGALSMQSYLETDIRRQCLLIAKKPQKSDSFRSSSMGFFSGRQQHQNTNRLAHPCSEWGKAHNPNQKLSTGLFSRLNSDQLGLQTNHSSKAPKKCGGTGKYDNLTTARKVEMIVSDDVQWLKLQQSLRDTGVWTSVGVQQVLHEHVRQRINDKEQLESAMSEINGPRRSTTPMNEEKKEEPATVVGTLTQFARKQFSRGTAQLMSQERRDNHSPSQKRRVTMGF